MKPKAEMMQSMRARKIKAGLKRVEFWIPASLVKRVKEAVARMVK